MWKIKILTLVLLLFLHAQAEGKRVNSGNDLYGISPDTIRPPALVNCPEFPGRGYHIVQPGQTLYAISKAYEIPIQSLIGWNKILNPGQIEVCQKIWLRKPGNESLAPVTYSTTTAYTPRSLPSLPVAKRQDIYWENTSERRLTPVVGVQQGNSSDDGRIPASYDHYYTSQPAKTSSRPGNMSMSPPSDCPEKSGLDYHIVQSGETLTSIAKKYMVDEEVLKRENNIRPSDRLKKCMRLKIPLVGSYSKQDSKPIYILPVVGSTTSLAEPDGQDPLKPTPYLVQKAESLVSFATRTKNNPQVLASLNKIPIDAKLRPGQSLILPSDRNRSSDFQD